MRDVYIRCSLPSKVHGKLKARAATERKTLQQLCIESLTRTALEKGRTRDK